MLQRTVLVAGALAMLACGGVTRPDRGCAEGETECNGECVDLDDDPLNCGACGTVCRSAAHAERVCEEGRCGLDCDDGWWDLDGDLLTGCEYECDFQAAVDVCNGEDDDCDGVVDNFDLDSCAQGSTVECATTCGSTGTGQCDAYCNRPTPAECTPPEETCNGEDDDCVLGPDDTFACVMGEQTACTTTCGSTGTGTCLETCAVPPPGACIPPEETCNGEDDDCVLGPDDTFACVMGEQVPCTTTCGSTGTGTCTDDCAVPPPEACTPPEETCNWVDDDCDGDVDEGLWAELIGDREISDTVLDAYYPKIESGDSRFLLSYSQDPSGDGALALYSGSLDAAGVLVGGGLLAGPNSNYNGDVAWSGSEFLVGFTDSRYSSFDVFAVRVGGNGEALDLEKLIIDHEGINTSVNVEWTGSAWGFGWIDQRVGTRLFIAEADAETLMVDFEENVTAGLGYLFGSMDMVWNGSGYGLCWGDNRDGAYQLYFKVVTAQGIDVVEDTPLTDTFDAVSHCSIAWTGSEYAMAWGGKDSGGPHTAHVVRVSADGTPVGDVLDLGQTSAWNVPPSAHVHVVDGRGFGLAWIHSSFTVDDVMMRRTDFALEPIDAPMQVSDGTSDTGGPSLAWDGSAFGVTWIRKEGSDDNDVMFSRVGCP